MSNTHNNDDDDDLFNDVLNPYESSIQRGKEDGRQAALEAGYKDGYQLGKLKAFEIGIELGYMESICNMALTNLTNHNNGNGNDIHQKHKGGNNENIVSSSSPTSSSSFNHERKRKRIIDLIDAIQSFPKPDLIFQHYTQKHNDMVKDNNDDSEEEKRVSGTITNCQDEKNDDSTLLSSSSREKIENLKHVDTDIVSMMQRLRAKFKTVLVQLNLSPLRLKDVMDKCNRFDSNINIKDQNKDTQHLDRIDEW